MAGTYVDMKELEDALRHNGCCFILDELESVSAGDIMNAVPVIDLKCALDGKKEVFATQVWTKTDIEAAMEALGVQPDKGLVAEVMQDAAKSLEDCSDNWDKLHASIKECMGRRQK